MKNKKNKYIFDYNITHTHQIAQLVLVVCVHFNKHNVDINFKTDDGLTLVMLTVGLEISAAVVEQLEYVVTKHKADCSSIDSNGNNAVSLESIKRMKLWRFHFLF